MPPTRARFQSARQGWPRKSRLEDHLPNKLGPALNAPRRGRRGTDRDPRSLQLAESAISLRGRVRRCVEAVVPYAGRHLSQVGRLFRSWLNCGVWRGSRVIDLQPGTAEDGHLVGLVGVLLRRVGIGDLLKRVVPGLIASRLRLTSMIGSGRHRSFCSVIAARRRSRRVLCGRVLWACSSAPDIRCRIAPRRGITNRSRGFELLAMSSMCATAGVSMTCGDGPGHVSCSRR